MYDKAANVYATHTIYSVFPKLLSLESLLKITMALSKPVKQNGGFVCEFLNQPQKAFQTECPVCLLVLREPYQATCCGYSFCKSCIDQIKADCQLCPTCQEDISDNFPNKGLQRSLYEFQVYCTYRNEGCDWIGELGQLDSHLNLNPAVSKLQEGCQHAEIECMHCLNLIKRCEITVHLSEQCLSRPYECEYCNSYKSTYKDVVENHFPTCGFLPVPCPNDCGASPERHSLQNHQTSECPQSLVKCDFLYAGCTVTLPRAEMTSHLSDNSVHHLSLLAAWCIKLEEENQALKLCQSKFSIVPVEFTVGGFKAMKESNLSWFSAPFYTHQKGYKMCLRVDANGTMMSRGTHASVFVHLMRGEYDGELKFPFQGDVTIQLLSQEDDYHCQHTIRFSDKILDVLGARVTTGDRAVFGFGVSKFINQHQLHPKYLKGNSLILRVLKVETK